MTGKFQKNSDFMIQFSRKKIFYYQLLAIILFQIQFFFQNEFFFTKRTNKNSSFLAVLNAAWKKSFLASIVVKGADAKFVRRASISCNISMLRNQKWTGKGTMFAKKLLRTGRELNPWPSLSRPWKTIKI